MIYGFIDDESGAVTIDWVALAAGILILGIAVVFNIFSEGVEPVVASIEDRLAVRAPALTPAPVPSPPSFD